MPCYKCQISFLEKLIQQIKHFTRLLLLQVKGFFITLVIVYSFYQLLTKLNIFSQDWIVIDVRRGLESLKQLLTILSWSRQKSHDVRKSCHFEIYESLSWKILGNYPSLVSFTLFFYSLTLLVHVCVQKLLKAHHCFRSEYL